MNPPFQKQNILNLKATSSLTALELSGSYLHTSAPLFYYYIIFYNCKIHMHEHSTMISLYYS